MDSICICLTKVPVFLCHPVLVQIANKMGFQKNIYIAAFIYVIINTIVDEVQV
jgi:hypothetical protein